MVQTGPLTKRKVERITKGKNKMTTWEAAQYKRMYGDDLEKAIVER
jgi:hypothetical protein